MNFKIFSRRFAIGLVATLALGSCKKEETGPTGPQGPAGPSLTGNLQGFVSLYDQYGSPILSGLSGIHDSIDGSSNVAITDSTGKYSFSNLSTGTYNFTIADAGFGSNKVQYLQLVGGGILNRDVHLSKIPGFNVTTLTAGFGPVTDTLTATVTADTRARTFIVFVGSTSSTSAAPATYLDFYTKQVPANQTTFKILVQPSDLYNLGLTAGTTAYFAAYGAAANYNNSSTYEDLNTGRTVFNAISTTPATASAVVQ